MFIIEPVLVILDLNKIKVEADASNYITEKIYLLRYLTVSNPVEISILI